MHYLYQVEEKILYFINLSLMAHFYTNAVITYTTAHSNIWAAGCVLPPQPFEPTRALSFSVAYLIASSKGARVLKGQVDVHFHYF
uniref:AlNc14C509G11977 protein n=1 Tax=Albugo laibachii Nc14 TaxID=890382 RepID=F0X0N1_9STRA|nr:AlNc14C509G11977 [Albugo laibachii Nc14]|eukprot:CCA27324.1 AlNc14C509G11977 [Albugo laibachii Nc14]